MSGGTGQQTKVMSIRRADAAGGRHRR